MEDRDSRIYRVDSRKNRVDIPDHDLPVSWLCENHHNFKTTFNVVADRGCPYCNFGKVDVEDLALYMGNDLTKEWNILSKDSPKLISTKSLNLEAIWGKDNVYQDANNNMYASLTDKRLISLMLNTYSEYPTLTKLKKMAKPVTEKDRYETKVDLSTPAIKRFAKYLNKEVNRATWELQQNVLSEVKFLGAFSLTKNWHTLVAWEIIDDEEMIAELDEVHSNTKVEGIYISAVVFPNNDTEPRSVIYKSKKPAKFYKEQRELLQNVFDKKELGLSNTQKVVMMPFYQMNGMAKYLNDPEFGTPEWSLKKKIPINTIQERFAYVRQFLCGLSQNRLAHHLAWEGINIDNKGVKYWEEKQTDEPSFVKNHFKDVIKVFSEHAFYLLQLDMTNDLHRKNIDFDWKPVGIKYIERFLSDFILYGTQDATDIQFPEIIQQTTELKLKDEKDLLWESAKIKKVSSRAKGDPYSEQDVIKKPYLIVQWINLLLDKDESEIVDDLDDQYDDESTKKEVYYLWHKANELYKPKTKKTSTKTKKGQKPPPF